jgi:1-acyl-sn-glycerol-3-phosphate acyltransferase
MPAGVPTTLPSRLVRFCFGQLVRRNLRGVWVRGELPAGPAVWAANHHSWWDFFVAHAAMRATGRNDLGVLMDPVNIASRLAYGWAGVVGADRPRTAVEVLRSGAVVVLFPEGELRSPGPLGPIRPGAVWFARRAHVPLLAVATRVVLRGHQAPEAYLDVTPVSAAGDLPSVLAGRLAILDHALATSDPARPLPGYRPVLSGVRSWSERISR